jgi:mitochondrial fission protein ELM1
VFDGLTFSDNDLWVLTDGRPGHISQTLGLAERLAGDPVVKRIRLRAPFRQASPFLGCAGARALAIGSAPIATPWPKLVITSGRQAIPLALMIRKATGQATPIVNVQDPGYFRRRFDLIVVPEHDRLSGPNILSTVGALGRVTPQKLAAAAAEFGPALAHLPRPRVAVLIGGANAIYRTPPDVAERIGSDLRRLADIGAGLMITFSRRTGPAMESAVRAQLAGADAVIWDGCGPNPYFAYLGLADHILATEDSASMISEAATTGKPISILPLVGGSPKFARFHDSMRARGVTRAFAGGLDTWHYDPLDETGRAAQAVRALFQTNRQTL